MSLIIDVLKRAQKDEIAKGPTPAFVKYPYEEGLQLRALISKHIWPIGVAIGFIVIMVPTVFLITSQGRESTPEAAVSHGTAIPSSELSSASPEPYFSQEESTSEQKEKMQPVGSEKTIPAPPEKDKEKKSENEDIPIGRISLEEGASQRIRHHFKLAVAYQKRRETVKAIERYKEVIEVDPLNVEAHNNLGVIYKDMGKPDEAVKEFQTVLSIDPQHEKARTNLGNVFYLQGNLDKAVQEFRAVLDVNPRNIDACINLGVIYKRLNRIGEAKKMFENALSIDPHCPEAHYILGLISEESEDTTEAILHYQKFVEFSGSSYRELGGKVKRHLETLSQSLK